MRRAREGGGDISIQERERLDGRTSPSQLEKDSEHSHTKGSQLGNLMTTLKGKAIKQ